VARGEPPGDGPPLPAPYRSPWGSLAEALGAVAADLRLRLRRLWRRNLEGELPLPALWPLRLAPLFWPLLLGGVVAGLAGLGGLLLHRSEAAPSPADTATRRGTAATTAITAAGVERQPPDLVSGEPADLGFNTTGADHAGPTGGPEPGSTPRAVPQDGHANDRSAAGPSGSGPERSTTPVSGDGTGGMAPKLVLDPLLELLSQGDDAELLLAVRPDPAVSRLSLTLSPAAAALPQPALLQQAERWQQRAREAGYERLELRDSRGRLRGRSALVGSGMILLAPAPDA